MEIVDTSPTIVAVVKKKRTDSDSPWKDILEMYLKDFFDYCLPELSALIDWDRKWTSLDQELHLLLKKSKSGKRIVDKLIRVFLKSGEEQWVLIHIEIQGAAKQFFPERMFTCAYRIHDKYRKPLISCAILTDTNNTWRPNYFETGIGNTRLSFQYEVIKILDYEHKIAELDTSMNPFASVILIQLMALKSKNKTDSERFNIKLALTKRLLSKGFTKDQIHKLFLFIDWLMNLPEPLEIEYNEVLLKLEENQKMAYVSSFERYVMKKGLEQGLEQGRQEGRQATLAIFDLLYKGESIERIIQITGASLKEIAEIKRHLHH